MGHRVKTLQEGSWYVFQQQAKKNRDKVYTIRLKPRWDGPVADDLREHFDPGRNRGSAFGVSWKYKDRKTAEQLLMLALLKWGA